MRTVWKYLGVLILLPLCFSCSDKASKPEFPMTFNGPSQNLKATEIVPTLDTRFPTNKNVIWCASFESAWKALEDLAGEPVSLEGSPEMAKFLNEAGDPRPHVPSACLYVAAGWNQKGIVRQIQNDMQQKFPNKQPPEFPGITPDSFVTYSCLEASLKFKVPYCQNRKPLTFTGRDGRKVNINSFGLLPGDHDKYTQVRAQGRVLFCKSDEKTDTLQEFAVDLCSGSSPSQIVVARIAPEPTFAAALARIEKEIAEWKKSLRRESSDLAESLQTIGPSDELLVPDFYWSISHVFSQIQGKAFENAKLKGQRLDIVRQDILFRLDKSGAELSSIAWALTAGGPRHFFCDCPFLIYMKKRGAQMPYFAMWIDNAELLRVWQIAEHDQLKIYNQQTVPPS
jgi:hypothetical protein